MTEKSGRHLIFIRHAHRDIDLLNQDNGLSERGRQKVKRLKSYFQTHWSGGEDAKVFRFLSSPLLRCLETLGPVAESMGAPLEIEPLLIEQSVAETLRDLHQRINDFLDLFRRDQNSWVCCSHGDWIPECVALLSGDTLQLEKGSLVIFDENLSHYKMLNLAES